MDKHHIVVVQSVQNKSRHETGSDLGLKNGLDFLQSTSVIERNASRLVDVLPHRQFFIKKEAKE